MKQLIVLTFFTFGLNSYAQEAFITKWKTDNKGSSCDSCVEIPTEGTGYGYDVDWDNDGIYDEFFTGDAFHDYGQPGEYTIAIKGNFPRIYFDDWNGAKESQKIIEIIQWGEIEWTSFRKAFKGCEFLTINATDAPDLSQVTDLSEMFSGAMILDTDFNSWDVSTIINMSAMFNYAMTFNGDISGWDVSSVTDMSDMFVRAKSFNSEISQWDVSSVTNMEEMFKIAESFNMPLNNWDVSGVRNMRSMFEDARSFNQPINNWNTSNVVVMWAMFRRATVFNQDLNNWNLSKVTDMSSMFSGASRFNGDISMWDMSNIDDMSNMFMNAFDFNSNINLWDVSNVEDMNRMFQSATTFNSELNNWNTSKVKSMVQMFENAESFNSDISSWDVSNTTILTFMFNEASAFNFSLGEWSLENIIGSGNSTGLDHMLDNSGMSPITYQSTLDGWSSQNIIPQNIILGAENLFYCEEESRSLLFQNGWIINGDKLIDEVTQCTSSTSNTSQLSVMLSPNPSNGVVTISFDSHINFDISMCNLERIVLHKNTNLSNSYSLDLSDVASGIYLISIITQDGIVTKRIVKQ